PHERLHDVVLRQHAVRVLCRVRLGRPLDRSAALDAGRNDVRPETVGTRSQLALIRRPRGGARAAAAGRRSRPARASTGSRRQLHARAGQMRLVGRGTQTVAGAPMTPSPAGRIVNITETVDNSQVRSFQIGIFVLCGLCLIMDGFDVQAWGYVAPSLFAEWGIASAAGRVASVTLIGVLVGSLVFSMLADKIGLRPVLIGPTLHFSALTLLPAQVTTLDQPLIIRLIGGFGLGAIMPNAVALVGEYSPKRSRVTAMLVVSNGFTIGAMVAGFIATYLIPRFGWR